MVDAPSIGLAFAAGMISFLSPCCLPLVPGYLASVSGGQPSSGRFDRRVLVRSSIFVGSFSLVFILFGLTATAIGAFLFDNQPLLNKFAGGLVIAMGAFMIAAVFAARLNRDWRPETLALRAGNGSPAMAGLAFAVAWTPCVGPALGAILGLAATSSGTLEGAGLLAVYSAGLALPFFASAFAFNTATRSFAFFKRHYATIQIVSGVVLVAMGVLVVTGELFRLNVEAQRLLDRWGLNLFRSV